MKLFSKAAGVFATALLITGGVAPVAQGQASQVVTPEDQDAYVQQFHHEGNTPPVVDGTRWLHRARSRRDPRGYPTSPRLWCTQGRTYSWSDVVR